MRRVFTIATALLVASGCGGDKNTPTTPSAPKQANITVTASPNPATASTCSPLCVATNGNSYQFRVTGTLTIQETAGVGGNVDSIVSGGISLTSADVTQRSGTSRVAASGSLVFPLNFVFGAADNPNASRSTVFPITVTFTDDRGNHLTGVSQWVAN
jgi:Flp pilus assembly protein TadG